MCSIAVTNKMSIDMQIMPLQSSVEMIDPIIPLATTSFSPVDDVRCICRRHTHSNWMETGDEWSSRRVACWLHRYKIQCQSSSLSSCWRTICCLYFSFLSSTFVCGRRLSRPHVVIISFKITDIIDRRTANSIASRKSNENNRKQMPFIHVHFYFGINKPTDAKNRPISEIVFLYILHER